MTQINLDIDMGRCHVVTKLNMWV